MQTGAFKIASGLVVFLAIVFGLYAGKKLLIPLVMAIFIWYLIHIIARLFESLPLGKYHLPRVISYLMSLLVIGVAISLLVRIVSENIAQVTTLAPVYQKKLIILLNNFQELLRIPENFRISSFLRNFDFGSILSQIALAIYSLTSRVGIVIIYLIFLFLEQGSFNRKITAWLVSRGSDPKEFKNLLQRVDSDVRKYLGIKTLASAGTGFASYLIFSALGLDFAGFWALLIFLFNYIPTFGSIAASFFPIVLALIQFESPIPALVITIGLLALQFLIGNILEPKLMGETLNMSPLFLVVSLAFWGTIWGIPGMILCVPILVVLLIIFSRFEKTRPVAILLSKDGNLRVPVSPK